MTVNDLISEIKLWGWTVKPEHLADFESYVRKMLEKNRVFLVWDFEDEICAIFFFYITSDYTKIYKKSTYAVLSHDDPDGHQLYIDKMLCKNWNLEIRRAIQNKIEDLFPQVEEAYYHRGPKDRCVKIKRRDLVLNP